MNLKEKEWVLNHRDQFELLGQGEYAKTLKLHPTTIYRWQIRAENGNLENEPPLPHTFPQATSLSTVERVLKTYLEFPGWGGKKISEYLLNNGITYLSPTTAQKIKNKVNKLIEDTEYELKVKTRYQALKPDDIWAIDFLEFKWYGQKIYIALLIDDHSRFILNWFLSTGPTTNLVVKMIDEAKKQYGKPQVIKSDNGPQFRKTFRKELDRRNIIHLNSPVFTPSFNGKVERVNLELRQIISNLKDLDNTNIVEGINQALKDYNELRPQQALGGVTPAQSYQGKAQKVKKEMEKFKQHQKQKRNLSSTTKEGDILIQINNNLSSKGITAPVKRGGKTIISVRFFSELFLEKDLD